MRSFTGFLFSYNLVKTTCTGITRVLTCIFGSLRDFIVQPHFLEDMQLCQYISIYWLRTEHLTTLKV